MNATAAARRAKHAASFTGPIALAVGSSMFAVTVLGPGHHGTAGAAIGSPSPAATPTVTVTVSAPPTEVAARPVPTTTASQPLVAAAAPAPGLAAGGPARTEEVGRARPTPEPVPSPAPTGTTSAGCDGRTAAVHAPTSLIAPCAITVGGGR